MADPAASLLDRINSVLSLADSIGRPLLPNRLRRQVWAWLVLYCISFSLDIFSLVSRILRALRTNAREPFWVISFDRQHFVRVNGLNCWILTALFDHAALIFLSLYYLECVPATPVTTTLSIGWAGSGVVLTTTGLWLQTCSLITALLTVVAQISEPEQDAAVRDSTEKVEEKLSVVSAEGGKKAAKKETWAGYLLRRPRITSTLMFLPWVIMLIPALFIAIHGATRLYRARNTLMRFIDLLRNIRRGVQSGALSAADGLSQYTNDVLPLAPIVQRQAIVAARWKGILFMFVTGWLALLLVLYSPIAFWSLSKLIRAANAPIITDSRRSSTNVISPTASSYPMKTLDTISPDNSDLAVTPYPDGDPNDDIPDISLRRRSGKLHQRILRSRYLFVIAHFTLASVGCLVFIICLPIAASLILHIGAPGLQHPTKDQVPVTSSTKLVTALAPSFWTHAIFTFLSGWAIAIGTWAEDRNFRATRSASSTRSDKFRLWDRLLGVVGLGPRPGSELNTQAEEEGEMAETDIYEMLKSGAPDRDRDGKGTWGWRWRRRGTLRGEDAAVPGPSNEARLAPSGSALDSPIGLGVGGIELYEHEHGELVFHTGVLSDQRDRKPSDGGLSDATTAVGCGGSAMGIVLEEDSDPGDKGKGVT